MPYYGDYYAGDPGLFSFVKKIKLGRIVGGVVKAAFPGAAGVLSAVRGIRGQTPARQLTRVEAVKPGAQVYTTPQLAARAAAIKKTTGGTVRFAQTTTSGAKGRITTTKAVSPFAQRMAAARAAKRRSFGS